MTRCLGLNFNCLTKDKIFADGGDIKFVVTVNSEFIVEAQNDSRFKEIISSNLSTIDGQVPFLLFKAFNPGVKVEKISGSDLIYDAIEYCKENKKKIFLLGGEEKVNKEAVLKVREDYGIEVDGFSPDFSPYPFKEDINNKIYSRLETFQPDVVFVGFGAKKQEFWIDDSLSRFRELGISIVVGSGGTFSFVTGDLKRAPIILQKLCLEGVYRFLVEPKFFRFKRLLKSLLVFKFIFKK